MDYQEAIEIFENEIKKLNTRPIHVNHIGDAEKAENAMKTAISAMQELNEYKQFGTPEEVREAVEKRKAKKPKGDLHSVPHYRCPNCNSTVKLYQNSVKDEICRWCGQVIDWGEEE